MKRHETTRYLVGVVALFSFGVGCAFGSRGSAQDRTDKATCETRLDNTLDFIGLVVDDVDSSVDRVAALLSSSAELRESRNHGWVGQSGSLYVMNKRSTFDRVRVGARGPFYAILEDEWVPVDLVLGTSQ